MKYYYTNLYNGYQGGARNIMYILTQEERIYLYECIEALIEDRDELMRRGFLEYHYTKAGQLSKRSKPHPDRLKTYWNQRDEDAIEFLKRCCYFTEYPTSVMLDPMDWQLEALVDKMLVKIYGRFDGKFSNWLALELTGELKSKDIFAHMNGKRELYQTAKNAGLLPPDLKLPY